MSFTILTAVFNDERFIAKAIESILGQSFSEFEYIIVDDGSTDSTPDILKSFAQKDSRITLLTQKNSGQANAKNNGIKYTCNEYIVMQDSDDLSSPERLHRLHDTIQDSDLDVITSNYTVVAEDDSHICTFAKPINITEKLSIGINSICHGATAFKRSSLLSVGGFNPFFRDSEDFDLYLRLMEKEAKFVKLDHVLYYYRLRNLSVTSSATNFERKTAYQNHLSRIHGERESYPVRPLSIRNPQYTYHHRVAEAIFWSDDYKKYRLFYSQNIQLSTLNRFRLYYIFACLPEIVRKVLKKLTISLRKLQYHLISH